MHYGVRYPLKGLPATLMLIDTFNYLLLVYANMDKNGSDSYIITLNGFTLNLNKSREGPISGS
jgi:hypothetical protein